MVGLGANGAMLTLDSLGPEETPGLWLGFPKLHTGGLQGTSCPASPEPSSPSGPTVPGVGLRPCHAPFPAPPHDLCFPRPLLFLVPPGRMACFLAFLKFPLRARQGVLEFRRALMLLPAQAPSSWLFRDAMECGSAQERDQMPAVA